MGTEYGSLARKVITRQDCITYFEHGQYRDDPAVRRLTQFAIEEMNRRGVDVL